MADSVVCGGCGIRLSAEYEGFPRKPCPVCDATTRNFSVSVTESLSISSTVIASQRYGHTGREVLGVEAEQHAIEWSSLTSHDAIITHPVAADFQELVRSAPFLTDGKLILYRGQGIRDGEAVPPSVERMGPLPMHLRPQEGRYHREGERVLYLADSEGGVRREMEAWCTQGTPYVIQVVVPVTSLKIADFSEWPSDHLITAIFARAELCNLRERGSGNYIFSQIVGRIVSEFFDGMIIPGVRGVPGAHYKNVVLFKGLVEWPNWTNPANPPYLLIPSTSLNLPHEY